MSFPTFDVNGNRTDIAKSSALFVGTTQERPEPPSKGMMRFNSDLSLAEVYTASDIWSGLPTYKTGQPPLLLNMSQTQASSSVTVSWQKFSEVYKDAFTGQSYPIYLQTFVDISYTQLNGNNNSNGWKTVHIGNGNYNTSGSATTPLTSITFTAATGTSSSNSTGYTLTFDNKPFTISLPSFTQNDKFDLRVYGVNNSGKIPLYVYINDVGLRSTAVPSAVIITNFHSFSKTQFQMDTSFNLDSSDPTIKSGITITDYDISYTLVESKSKETVTDNGVQQRDNYNNKNDISLNSLKPGAKYDVQIRAKNALNTNGGTGSNGFGPYGTVKTSNFTNDGNAFRFINTDDLNSVDIDGMQITLTGNASINGHIHGTNSRTNRTILSANNSSSMINLSGTSTFYINYGKQGKTLDATTGNLVTATFTINTNGSTTDISSIQYTNTAASNTASIGATGYQYQFTSAGSYIDQGKTNNYSKGFVYSSNFVCTNGNNNNTIFKENFPASTDYYDLNYSIVSQTANASQRIDESGSTSISISTGSFYVDDYDSTPNVSFNNNPTNNNPTISVTSSTYLFGIPSVTQLQLTANYTISNFASYYIPYSDNRHSTVNAIIKNGYSFDVSYNNTVFQNIPYTMDYIKTSDVTANSYDTDTSSNFIVTVFYLNNSGTSNDGLSITKPIIETHTDNTKDVDDIGKIFRDSANTYSGATLYFFNGSSTISSAIATDSATFESTYSSSISSTLLYFNGRFVSGGYSRDYNGQPISPFSDWSNGYAVSGANYNNYNITGVGGFKWIAINVTNKKIGNTVNLSNFKINDSAPNTTNFTTDYEAYISHDGKFGALNKAHSPGATSWFQNTIYNTTIQDAKNASANGALQSNGRDAYIDSNTTTTVYLIVGLKQNATSYFTFS